MNWLILALLISTAQAGEIQNLLTEGNYEEQDIAWTQRRINKRIKNQTVDGTSFEIKPRAVARLKNAKRDRIRLPIYVSGIRQVWTLKRTDTISNASGSHYLAANKSDAASYGSISVYDSRIEGVLHTGGKTYSLSTKGVVAELIDTTNLPNEQELSGDVVEAPNAGETQQVAQAQSTAQNALPVVNAGFPVRIGIEVDHQMYIAMGRNEANIRTLVETLAAARNAYYLNEGIEMAVSGIKIWTTPDPYANYAVGATNSINSVLFQFASKTPRYGGAHLMELLTIRPGWGGIAYLNALGNSYFHHSVSSIYTTFVNNPVYNWPLNVVVHEIGHNLGSPHTHACQWVRDGQGSQAIDGCATPEGLCPQPTVTATFRGTVMSYCHLRGQMDMTLGFGEQPRNRIRNVVAQNLAFLGDTGGSPDRVAPIVSLSSPSSGATIVGSGARRTISLVADARDDRAMGSVEFQLSGCGLPSAGVTLTVGGAGPYATTVNTRDYNMTNGQCAVRARARDAAGNVSQWTGTNLFTLNNAPVDTVAPTLTLLPAEGTRWSSGSMTFTLTGNDNVGVTRLELFGNGQIMLGRNFSTSGQQTASQTYNFGVFPSGNLVLLARAYDLDGNITRIDRTIQVGAVEPPPPPPPPPASFGIASSVVGQDKTVADATKRNWIDLTLTNVVGTPTFQAKAAANTSWSSKAGADAVSRGNGVWRIFFWNANTLYDVAALCNSCSPQGRAQVQFRTLP